MKTATVRDLRNRYTSVLRWVSAGEDVLIVTTSNLADVVDEAKRISSTRTLTGGYRGFGILHVASALKMNASHFLTFDANQKKLAEAEGLVVPV